MRGNGHKLERRRFGDSVTVSLTTTCSLHAVLGLARMEFMLLIAARMVLCFTPVTKTRLVAHQCLSNCCTYKDNSPPAPQEPKIHGANQNRCRVFTRSLSGSVLRTITRTLLLLIAHHCQMKVHWMSELVFDTSCMAEVLDLAFSLSFLP